jgi:hypothetical protein
MRRSRRLDKVVITLRTMPRPPASGSAEVLDMKTMSRGGYLTGKVPTARHDVPDQPSPELRLNGTIRLNRGQTGSA